MLGAHLGANPTQIEFAYGPQGKPALAGAHSTSGLEFNVSHSEDQALIAIAIGRPVGVDLEYVRPFRTPDERPLIIFSAAELAVFEALPEAHQDRAFYTAWTRKEAIVKALGLGFSMDVTQVEVQFTPGSPAHLLRLHSDVAEASRWTLRDVAVPRGFVAAVALGPRLAK